MAYGQSKPFADEKNPNLRFNSGDYEIIEFTMGKLVDDAKEGVEYQDIVDLSDLYVSFSLSQSINEMFMSLTVSMGEAKHVFERLGSTGMQGEEFVFLKFKTPTREVIDQIFYVASYSGVGQTDHGTGTGIVLNCVAKEKFINDMITVNKSYSNSISEIVKSILENNLLKSGIYRELGSGNLGRDGLARKWITPELEIDETSVRHDLIIPGYDPFGSIEWLLPRAFNAHNQPHGSPLFRMYHNCKGLHFADITTRIANQIMVSRVLEDPSSVVPEFTFDPNIGDEQRQSLEHFRNIQSMSPMSTPNTFERLHDGTHMSTCRTIDIQKKNWYDTNFDVLDFYSEMESTGNIFNTTDNFYKKFSTPYEETIIKDTTKKYEPFEMTNPRKRSFARLLTTFNFNIVVYGDTNLNVGEVVKITLPEGGATKEKEDSMYSGHYFITDLQHTVDRQKFNTIMTVAKDSLNNVHPREGNS